MHTNSLRLRSALFLAFSSALILGACSGGGSNNPTVQGTGAVELEDSSTGGVDEPVSGIHSEVLFPERPIVNPASSRAEITSRANELLVEHRIFMGEVFRQMDEVYRTIGSGLESSQDPVVLERDAEFYETVNEYCAPEFGNTGTMVALRTCGRLDAKFALRHPRYKNVNILTSKFGLGTGFLDTVRVNTQVS